MSERVVVIASGETERRSLPFLLAGLAAEGVTIEDVCIPPGHRAVNAVVAERIVRSVWFERVVNERPDKFVVLLDTDKSHPRDVLAPIRADLPPRLPDIDANIQFAYAQRHLEAWYFADSGGLRRFLGRDLGKRGFFATG